jgi:hypothetical protein
MLVGLGTATRPSTTMVEERAGFVGLGFESLVVADRQGTPARHRPRFCRRLRRQSFLIAQSLGTAGISWHSECRYISLGPPTQHTCKASQFTVRGRWKIYSSASSLSELSFGDVGRDSYGRLSHSLHLGDTANVKLPMPSLNAIVEWRLRFYIFEKHGPASELSPPACRKTSWERP